MKQGFFKLYLLTFRISNILNLFSVQNIPHYAPTPKVGAFLCLNVERRLQAK